MGVCRWIDGWVIDRWTNGLSVFPSVWYQVKCFVGAAPRLALPLLYPRHMGLCIKWVPTKCL